MLSHLFKVIYCKWSKNTLSSYYDLFPINSSYFTSFVYSVFNSLLLYIFSTSSPSRQLFFSFTSSPPPLWSITSLQLYLPFISLHPLFSSFTSFPLSSVTFCLTSTFTYLEFPLFPVIFSRLLSFFLRPLLFNFIFFLRLVFYQFFLLHVFSLLLIACSVFSCMSSLSSLGNL